MQTLNGVANPNGTTDYLKAIVSARTNDTSGVVSNLRAAIAKDRTFVKEAANDLEFAKYATNAEFTSLLR
jgi:hypothetical protein